MIETKSICLSLPVNQAGAVFNFTEADNLHWAGIVDLPAHHRLPLETNARNDLYIVCGELIEGTDTTHSAGTFISRHPNAVLTAGAGGVRLFLYRDRCTKSEDEATVVPGGLRWYEGRGTGMKIAPIRESPQQLMLVSWVRGTQMRFHRHPHGEELLVLAGELCDPRGRYPAGTWQRLHPGAGHSPYSETETLILLRNGHLRP